MPQGNEKAPASLGTFSHFFGTDGIERCLLSYLIAFFGKVVMIFTFVAFTTSAVVSIVPTTTTFCPATRSAAVAAAPSF